MATPHIIAHVTWTQYRPLPRALPPGSPGTTIPDPTPIIPSPPAPAGGGEMSEDLGGDIERIKV
jgi:hypothetical protein